MVRLKMLLSACLNHKGYGLRNISSYITLHLIKVEKLKRFKKVSSDLRISSCAKTSLVRPLVAGEENLNEYLHNLRKVSWERLSLW